MDPIVITKLLSVLMANPAMVADGVNKFNAPGSINATQMQESLADASMGVLNCYHKTARFRGVDPLFSNWNRQGQYGAEQSEVIKIHFNGVSGLPYEMVVAVMRKESSIRTFVIDENALVPYNRRCELERWVKGELANTDIDTIKRGWIGIAIQEITPKLAELLKLNGESGALVADVLKNGPAGMAELYAGDVLLEIDGQPISDTKALSKSIAAIPPEQIIVFKVLRGEERLDIDVIVGEKPTP